MERADIPGFGGTLANFRKRKGMSQEHLAHEIGKSRRTIIAWEAGEYLPKAKGDVMELVRLLALTQEEVILLLQTAGMDPTPERINPDQGIWKIPFQRNRNFTGRDALLDQLDAHLAPTGKQHMMTADRAALTQAQAIRGLGGIGKTQIAAEYAFRSRDRNRYQHTLWINAASEESLFTSFTEVAQKLPDDFSAKSEANQRKVVDAVNHWLEQCQQRWLLIFDNADDLEMVSTYFPDTSRGNGSILLTTRATEVSALAKAVEVDIMGTVEGTELLLRRAGRFEGASDDEFNEASSVVIALDHFPLALDQAGAYLEGHQNNYKAYLELYRTERQKLLVSRGKQTVRYPDSVATTWLVNFQQVEKNNPAAAELLSLLTFLAPDKIQSELLIKGADGWPQVLQQAVTYPYAFDQMLQELLKYSLVKRLVQENALSIHRLVQAVQKDRMSYEKQRNWAECVIRAVDQVFPQSPTDIVTWPQCIEYLDQAQVCQTLIEEYQLFFEAGADILNRAGLYISNHLSYEIAEPLYKRALAIREQQFGPEHLATAPSLNNLGLLYSQQGRYVEAEALLKRTVAIHEQQVGPTDTLTAKSLNNLAVLYVELGKYAEAELLHQRALTIYEQQEGPEHPHTAWCLNSLAGLYREQGKYPESEQLYKQALAIRERQLGLTHPDTATSLNGLATLYMIQGKYIEAEPLYQKALTISEQLMGPEHPHTAQSLNNLAYLFVAIGEYTKAEPLYEQAMSIRKKMVGLMHPDTAQSLNNLAGLYDAQGRYDEAEPLYQSVLTIYERLLGANHPNTALSLNNLAATYGDQGRYAEAEPLYQRALIIYEQQVGLEHPDTARCLNNLAYIYQEQKKYSEAEQLYFRALAIYERQFDPMHPLRALTLNNLGYFYYSQERYLEAEPYYQQALTIREQQLGPEHPDTLISLDNLASLYFDQGKYSEAEPLHVRALTVQEQQLGVDHPHTIISRSNLIALYEAQDNYAAAEPLLRCALTIREQQLGGDHVKTAVSLNNLAYASHILGMYREAELLYLRALQIYEQQVGPDHPKTATCLNNIAYLYETQGRCTQAKPLYQRALTIREQQLGPEHPDTIYSRQVLEELCRELDQDEET